MTNKSRIIIALSLGIVISIIYFSNKIDKPMEVNSVGQINDIIKEIKPAPHHLDHSSKTINAPTLSKESQKKQEGDNDKTDSQKTGTFLISGIAVPDNLPDYLLNIPFTSLDVNYENLSTLKAGDRISIPLISGDSINLVINKNTTKQNLSVIKGIFEAGDINLPASLTYRKGSIFGSIATTDGEYRISKISGMHVIYKIPALEGEPDNDAMIFVPH